MSLNFLKDKGTPLEKQRFTWKDLVQKPISKQTVLPGGAKTFSTCHTSHAEKTGLNEMAVEFSSG